MSKLIITPIWNWNTERLINLTNCTKWAESSQGLDLQKNHLENQDKLLDFREPGWEGAESWVGQTQHSQPSPWSPPSLGIKVVVPILGKSWCPQPTDSDGAGAVAFGTGVLNSQAEMCSEGWVYFREDQDEMRLMKIGALPQLPLAW